MVSCVKPRIFIRSKKVSVSSPPICANSGRAARHRGQHREQRARPVERVDHAVLERHDQQLLGVVAFGEHRVVGRIGLVQHLAGQLHDEADPPGLVAVGQRLGTRLIGLDRLRWRIVVAGMTILRSRRAGQAEDRQPQSGAEPAPHPDRATRRAHGISPASVAKLSPGAGGASALPAPFSGLRDTGDPAGIRCGSPERAARSPADRGPSPRSAPPRPWHRCRPRARDRAPRSPCVGPGP